MVSARSCEAQGHWPQCSICVEFLTGKGLDETSFKYKIKELQSRREKELEVTLAHASVLKPLKKRKVPVQEMDFSELVKKEDPESEPKLAKVPWPEGIWLLMLIFLVVSATGRV